MTEQCDFKNSLDRETYQLLVERIALGLYLLNAPVHFKEGYWERECRHIHDLYMSRARFVVSFVLESESDRQTTSKMDSRDL